MSRRPRAAGTREVAWEVAKAVRSAFAILGAGLVLLLAAVVGATVVVPSSALAQAQPNGPDHGPGPGLSLDDPEVAPGAAVTVRAVGCFPGTPVVLSFDGVQVATATAGEGGARAMTFTVPASAAAGDHLVSEAGCAPVDLPLTANLIVPGPARPVFAPQPEPASTLPFRVAPIAIGAIALLVHRSHRDRRGVPRR